MNRFKNILFFADSSSQEKHPGLERAVKLAETNDARLTVIDVIEEYEDVFNTEVRSGVTLNHLLYEDRMEYLSQLVSPYQTPKNLIYTSVLTGKAYAEIIRKVIHNKYDLVMKDMSPPSNLGERILGSTDQHLLRKCPCPVWINRSDIHTPYKKILAAIDPMDDKYVALSILQLAKSLAEREQTNYEVMHSWRLVGESLLRSGRARLPKMEVDLIEAKKREQQLDKFNEILSEIDLSHKDNNVHFVKGYATNRIIEFGESADLIIMGTLGRAGIPGFLIGNTAEEVMQNVTTSILAIKPLSFVSPIV